MTVGMAMTYLRLPPSFEGGNDPARTARLAFGSPDWRSRHRRAQLLDIADFWQGLHYLITGDPWEGERPGADIVCGGPLVAQAEQAPAQLSMDVIYLSPKRVKDAADHLAKTPFTVIEARYDGAHMAELEIESAARWLSRPNDEVCRELRSVYENLAVFFGAAAATGQSIFKSMTSTADRG
jgi:hypothetical protein